MQNTQRLELEITLFQLVREYPDIAETLEKAALAVSTNTVAYLENRVRELELDRISQAEVNRHLRAQIRRMETGRKIDLDIQNAIKSRRATEAARP